MARPKQKQTPGAVCKACAHPARYAIEQEIVTGVAYRAIARAYGLSDAGVRAHAKDHLPNLVANAPSVREAVRAESILQRVLSYEQWAVDLGRRADSEGDYRSAIRAIGEARSCLELLTKVAGLLAPDPTRPTVAEVVASLPVDQALQILKALEAEEEAARRTVDSTVVT